MSSARHPDGFAPAQRCSRRGALLTLGGLAGWVCGPGRQAAAAPGVVQVPTAAALQQVQVQAQPQEPVRAMHFPFGAVRPPRPVLPWKVTTHEGSATDLATLLRGQWTAVQLIFTGCSAICPLQGAQFGQAQRELQKRKLPAQLMSVSIDPMGDTPQALAKWLRQFGAGPGWTAVAPRVEDVGPLSDLLGSGGEDARKTGDVHSGQVFVIDRRGMLVHRTASMPPALQVVDALERLLSEAR